MNINVGALVLTGITIIAGVSTAAALSHLARMANGRMKAMRSSDILDDISAFSFGEKEVHNEKSGKNIENYCFHSSIPVSYTQ